jgi:hypothetical protein
MASGAGVWVVLGVALAAAGCSSPCEEVAKLLRDCCAKGPPELRKGCEEDAQHLEKDGNSDACQSALDRGIYQRCER